MRGIVRSFIRQYGQDYKVIRDGEEIGKFRGLPNEDSDGKYIGFYPDTDIRPEDWLISVETGDELYVYDRQTKVFGRSASHVCCYYWTKRQYEREKAAKQKNQGVTFNFNAPVSQSIIGTQENASLTIYIEDLYQQIEDNGGNEKEELKKMVDEIINEISENGELKKSRLEKFSDLLAKHSWITSPLSTVIFKMLFGV